MIFFVLENVFPFFYIYDFLSDSEWNVMYKNKYLPSILSPFLSKVDYILKMYHLYVYKYMYILIKHAFIYIRIETFHLQIVLQMEHFHFQM